MQSNPTGWQALSCDAHAFARYLTSKGVIDLADLDRAYLYLQEHNPRLGEIAVKSRLLTPEEVDQVLEKQAECGSPFGQAALQTGLLTAAQLELLLQEQNNVVLSLGHALFAMGILTAEQMVQELVAFDLRPDQFASVEFSEADIVPPALDEDRAA
jgi:hypothetical protein